LNFNIAFSLKYYINNKVSKFLGMCGTIPKTQNKNPQNAKLNVMR
jgi:hypothetical protein